MHHRNGFTIVELIISVAVVAILAAITAVSYNGLRAAALQHVAETNLQSAAEAMQLEHLTSGEYPTILPSSITGTTNGNSGEDSDSSSRSHDGIELTLKWSSVFTRYASLSAVQNGVLLSQICQTLIDEGVGKGVDKGGNTQAYITGCGNWNHNSMQVTGWNSRVWSTPVTREQLLQYGDTFTTSDTWNGVQATVVKNFYTQLVQRQESMGGSFPVASFWDSWANSNNGGVIYQNLPDSPQAKASFCIEATANGIDKVWHIDEGGVVRDGACDLGSK